MLVRIDKGRLGLEDGGSSSGSSSGKVGDEIEEYRSK